VHVAAVHPALALSTRKSAGGGRVGDDGAGDCGGHGSRGHHEPAPAQPGAVIPVAVIVDRIEHRGDDLLSPLYRTALSRPDAAACRPVPAVPTMARRQHDGEIRLCIRVVFELDCRLCHESAPIGATSREDVRSAAI